MKIKYPFLFAKLWVLGGFGSMWDLTELARAVEGARVYGTAKIADICYDSRKVKPGDLFVCVCGFSSDGHIFATEAVAKGAVALVVEHPVANVNIPYILVPNSRRALAQLAKEFFGRPADELVNIGITGTNGKTSVAFFACSILQSLGYNPGLMGTIEARIGDRTFALPNTTPESLDLQRYLREMRDSGQDSVVMEVSSHALVLDRTYGIPYDIAVFTNLTQDHLDFHKTMGAYFEAKRKLFTDLGTCKGRPCAPCAVINIDDPYGKQLCEILRQRVPVITYGVDVKADVRAYNIDASPEGLRFIVETRLGVSEVRLPISGMFNVHNSLAAIAVGVALRGDLARIVAGAEAVSSVPGRFQLVREGQNFTVIVDYAHTPDGLQRLLESARAITSNELTVVFGCGGDRDKDKRPKMGKIAADLADRVIVTTDNPRSEDIESIISQIMDGVKMGSANAQVEVIIDRNTAIAKAIGMAKAGDTVVIAGKGHETYQKFRDRTVHFDDVEVARNNLRHLCAVSMLAPYMPKVRLPISWDCSCLRTAKEVEELLLESRRKKRIG